MKYDFELSDVEFFMWREFIHNKFGLYFKDERMGFLRMKLYPRVKSLGLSSFGEYLQIVRSGRNGNGELYRMISLLTNTESYFFRETAQMYVLRDHLLPELHRRCSERQENKINILSAGCSTGEEVYTLAMLIYETGNIALQRDVRIIGMDVNESALEAARRGIYYHRSLRMTDDENMKKFFIPLSGGYAVKERIKEMTSFVKGNIADPLTWPPGNDLNVILCRNVLIYFSEDKMREAVINLSNALGPGAYLLLGHSETQAAAISDLEPRRFPEAIIYKKRNCAENGVNGINLGATHELLSND